MCRSFFISYIISQIIPVWDHCGVGAGGGFKIIQQLVGLANNLQRGGNLWVFKNKNGKCCTLCMHNMYIIAAIIVKNYEIRI